jgi:transcriptional regulator with XRE-family HTH domain
VGGSFFAKKQRLTLYSHSSIMSIEVEYQTRKDKQMNPQVIEKYRIKKGINCAELCRRMKKTDGWYSRIRSGERHLLPNHIEEMAAVLGVKPDKLAKEYYSFKKNKEDKHNV